MAFREIQVTDVHDMITKLHTFCSTTLGWFKAASNEFQPYENGEKFQIFDVVTNGIIMQANLYSNVTSLKTKIVGDTVSSGCDCLIAFERVWFCGDRGSVMVVIQTYPNIFKWFGFGEIRATSNPIAWNVGSKWNHEPRTYIHNLGFLNSMYTTFFGVNGCNDEIYKTADTANRIKYKGVYYSDSRANTEEYVNFFGGGASSYPYTKYACLFENKLTGQRFISKTPLFIHKSPRGKRVIIGEMPLWYVCGLRNIRPTQTFEVGGKRYMAFPIGHYNINVPKGNYYVNTEQLKHYMIAPLTYEQGFALPMDD